MNLPFIHQRISPSLHIMYNICRERGLSCRGSRPPRQAGHALTAQTHCETPSGTHRHPIGLLGSSEGCRGAALFYVDTVAGLGRAPVHMDGMERRPDAPAAPKCLSAPSMSMVGVSDAAWNA